MSTIEVECARLCSEWVGQIEETLDDFIHDHLVEEDDEE